MSEINKRFQNIRCFQCQNHTFTLHGKSLTKSENFLQIVHVNHFHWILLSNCLTECGEDEFPTVRAYDSLNRHRHCISELKEVLNILYANTDVSCVNVECKDGQK